MPTPVLTAELEALLLREVARAWDELNHTHFQGRLRPPAFALLEGGTRLGAWSSTSRTIQLARALVTGHPWGVVVEVLRHEIAHQFSDEALGAGHEPPHGPTFRAVCARMGLDPAASGLPLDPGGGDPARSRALRRIQGLLALADSPNRHEAEAAMNAAHRMMRKHNIDHSGQPAAYGARQLGSVRARFSPHEKILGGLLARHFFVTSIWVPAYDVRRGKRGRALEVCGSPENLDMAEYVHGFLLSQAERLWRAHKRTQRLRSDAERQRFLAGVMVGFSDTLSRQAAACHQEGLVWLGDPALGDYVGQRHPRLRAGRRSSIRATDAWRDGRAAGQRLVLRKPVSERAVSQGRLLGDGSD